MNYNFSSVNDHARDIVKSCQLFNTILKPKSEKAISVHAEFHCEPNRLGSFVIARGSPGTYEFPQLAVKCSAADISKMSVDFVEWQIGGSRILRYDWNLIFFLNKMRKDSPFFPMKRYALSLYMLLRKTAMFQLIANSVVLYALLQHSDWAPYVWMLQFAHEMQQIESMHDITYLIPLCFPLGSNRFSPRFHNFSFSLSGFPESMSRQPTLDFCHNNITDYEIYLTKREQVITGYEILSIEQCHDEIKKQIKINCISGLHSGYCLLVFIGGCLSNVNQFKLELTSRDNSRYISGALQRVHGCRGWYSITTDPKLNVQDAINMNCLPNDSVKYLNLTRCDAATLTLSNLNDENLNIECDAEIRVYWQHQNVLGDYLGICGPLFC